MPTGVLIDRPKIFLGKGSSNLVSASLHPPTDRSYPILDGPAAGPKAYRANPTPAWFRCSGLGAGAEDLAIFERIHVIPRSEDFGVVLSDQEVEVEVWNAYRSQDQLLTEITVDGPFGIEVVDPYGQPVVYPATESKIYRVKALASGDPRIDNLVTWLFEHLDNSGNTLSLTGFRVLPWPFEANLEQPIEMEYGYATNVFTARQRTEQRIGLRKLPQGSVSFSSLLKDAREADLANALLYGGQSRPWGVPLWQWSSRLNASAAAGQKSLAVETSFGRFIPGGLVFIWENPFTWEVQRIATVDAHTVTTGLNLGLPWPAGKTWVMPLAIGRLSTKETFNWESLIVGSTRFSFEIEAFDT